MAPSSRVHKVSMNGGLPGVASIIVIYPEEKLAIIALSNFRKPPVYQIAQNVGKLIFADDVTAQAAVPATAPQSDESPEPN
jgi:hypothetical protein